MTVLPPKTAQILLALAPESLATIERSLLGETYELTRAATALGAARLLRENQFSLVIVDNELDAWLEARIESGEKGTWVIAVVRSDEEAARAFELGVSDVLFEPVRGSEVAGRLRNLLGMQLQLAELARKRRDAQVMAELTQALSSSLDFRDILHTVVKRIAEVVGVDRASIVLVPEEGDIAYVIAASDESQPGNRKIELPKYPEIQTVLRTGAPLTIDDVTTHPVLDGVRSGVSHIQHSSLTLLPIRWANQVIGVLFLRAAAGRGSLSEREIAFSSIVANATGTALRNARAIQSLRDRNQEITFAHFEAQERSRTLKRYADYFASSADGLAAVDGTGNLLFANPRAFELIGYSESEGLALNFGHFFDPSDREKAIESLRSVVSGNFEHDIDLKMRRKDGATRIMNFSFSPLMDNEGAVLFSFRDVTEVRTTAAELVHTKEFLEKLIAASVDAIVASDMNGTIILFNAGAERIYGYTAEEVLGKMNARILYPKGGAREVLQRLESEGYGGVGRLENMQTEAVAKDGERIPILLSAAMIYEGEKPVATFGIFMDLREKIRVEQKLNQAQEQLALSERQMYLAELAGAAAHELNQPLTSILAYSEMLRRRLAASAGEQRYADVIFTQAERMADIVRKIGRITKYETKTYVGSQRILDLDKSSSDDHTPEPTK